MHPAPSVIFFTVMSGAGYGLIGVIALALSVGGLEITGGAVPAACVLAVIMITVGLISSTFHLGRPDRAWRALSQWRSSWLSREGVAAVLAYVPILLFTLSALRGEAPAPLVTFLTLVMAIVTVICTGMIYASLPTVPLWNRSIVPLIYLSLAGASGALWAIFLLGLFGKELLWLEWFAFFMIVIAWGLKWYEMRSRADMEASSTAGTALGLDYDTTTKLVEPPHQGKNYLLREMAFEIGRKHAEKLRNLMWIFGLIVPLVALLLIVIAPATALGGFLALVAVGCGMLGCVIERWLFFAEARHKVTLYYGATRV